ncbi:uncharacterized protein TM35_001151060 [Trypanosoma theileri]|uniref:Mucin TcMUCII n=1 Tax=Trypanosoma theileri TaxID=67003 RepID=A0A1X0NDW2_9TRYP|nr:uncharacterized protein TM35_001151060 [Trypanosoma theileri]ORC81499.1 hypothetical protein TM35_001151060 [Trypanosoma theileri]
MIKAVMVRCYLLCLLTLALCCACGLVWADSPKASDAPIKPSTVGVPSLVHHAIPAFELIPDELDDYYSTMVCGKNECKAEDVNTGQPAETERSKQSEDSLPERTVSSSHPSLNPEKQPGSTSRQAGSHVGSLLPSTLSSQEQGLAANQVDSQRIKNGEHVASHNMGGGDGKEDQRLETSVGENHSQSTAQESARDSPLKVPGSTPEKEKVLSEQESQPSQTESHETQDPQTTQPNVQGTNNGHDSSAPTTQSTGDVSLSNTTTDVTHNKQAENGTNVAKPAESESTTTTTTTTTTTLPPEPTNNKKGDADSSSSISSSVWVRVPLLIVFTLACILVC